jgi:hypothetical protein
MALKWIGIVGAGLLLSAGSVPADVAGLAWMSGTWVAANSESWMEERWSQPRGGVMLGTNLSGTGIRAAGFEFMRIAAEPDGTVNYWGSPGGKPAVPFRLTSSGPNAVVFENPTHDFPTRIAYRRNGETMTATVSGAGGKNAQSWRFRRR